MGIDAHVPRGPTEALPLTIGYMLLRLRIPILLRHPKIHNMDQVRVTRPWSTDEEVIGFDVPVDETSFVDGLYARDLRCGLWLGSGGPRRLDLGGFRLWEGVVG